MEGHDLKFRLIPRNESFFPVFIQSSENVLHGAVELNKMINSRLGDSKAAMKEIKVIEKLGDTFTREIISKVHNSFITPFDREDIHELAEGLDDILDEILNVADVLVLHVVKEENDYLIELSSVLVSACEHVDSLVKRLKKLNGIDIELDAIEESRRKARKIYREAVTSLFSGEFKSFEVLKLKDVIESLREAVKQTDRVADIIESISLKHS